MNEAPQGPIDVEPGGPPDPAPVADAPTRVRGRKRRAVRRWTRRAVLITAAIIATLIVTFFTVDIGHISIGGQSIKTLAETRASRFLERGMTIGRISAYVTPGKFAFDDVVIKGPYPNARPFFSAKRITVEVPWWTLFRKELYIDVRLTGWRMVVEKWPDNQAHLPRLTSKNPSGKPFPLKIRGLTVYGSGGEFVYDDHVTPWSVIGPNLKFDLVRANNLNTYVGAAQFSGGKVQIQNFEPMTADFRARFQLEGPIVRLNHIDLLTDGAESHISGYVNFGNWPEQEYDIQSTVDFNRMRELFFAKASWRLSGTGRFNGVFKIFKKGGFDLSGLFKSDEAGLGTGNAEWRFPNLNGALQWTPNSFVVSRADSDFLGGRMTLAYGLVPLGTPGGATATLSSDYAGVDLYRFTRQFGWTALEPQGRMRGHVAMAWHNGQFSETLQGRGTTVILPEGDQAVAGATLPSTAKDIPPERGFQKYRPFGAFPLGADTTYTFSASSLDFSQSWAATPTTFVSFSGRARGGPVDVPFHVTSHNWQNSDRLFAAIMSNFSHPMGAIEVGGRGTFDGALTKSFNAPRIEGRFASDAMRAWGVVWGRATGAIAIENSYLDVTDGRIEYTGGGRVLTSGRYSLGYPRADGGEEINAHIRAERMPLPPLRTAFGLDDWPVDGVLAVADLTLRGAYEKPGGQGTMRIENGTAWKEPFDSATGDLLFERDGSLRLQRIEIAKGTGLVTGDAWLSWAAGAFSVDAVGTGIPVEELATFRIEGVPLSGALSFTARGSGGFDLPTWRIEAQVPDLYAADEGVGAVRARLTMANNVLTIGEIVAASDRLQVDCQGNIALNTAYDSTLHCRFVKTSLDPYFKFVGRELPYTKAIATGSIDLTGPLRDTAHLTVDARVDDAALTLFDYELTNDGPVQLSFRQNAFRLDRVRFKGVDTENLELGGTADITTRTANLNARGQASLAVLQAFYPSLSASGGATLQATLTGSFDDLVLAGQADITRGYLRHQSMPHGLSEINGRITVEAGRISVNGLRAVMGEGPVTFDGGIALNGYRPEEFDLHAIGESMHLRFPEGLQSTVMADLRLRGPIGAPVLSGNVDVLRASYSLRVQPQTGYLGLLTGAVDTGGGSPAPPADTPSAFPLTLAIKVKAPQMPFVENKGASAFINGSADVDITGTIDHPVITGRVDVDSGQWVVSGNRYRLLGGSVDFNNPLRFDPFFDVTAETSIRTPGQTYLVTVRINGTLDKLNPTLTSEPWLPEFQIVSLILGETPDVGSAELRALSSPQELQAQALQTAAFAIITSPISATVGNALQRVTTIDTVQIVPLLGNESNITQLLPTARIILGKRISDRVYLTYSRTITGAQNEIILIEFDQNDQISWVLSRNEDRSFALDFRLRYVFR